MTVKIPIPATSRLDDDDAEQARKEFERVVLQILKIPVLALTVIKDKTLADGAVTPIAHGLGRVPLFMVPSPPRGPVTTGRIEEVRDGTYDRAKFVVLKATGFGGPITIDLAVM